METAYCWLLTHALLYGGAVGLTDGRQLAGDGRPPKLLLANGFMAVNCAVGLACRPSRNLLFVRCTYFEMLLLLLLLLGLVQLFVYAAMAVGMAACRKLQVLVVPLGRITGLFVLAAVAIAADCVF